MQVFVTPVGRLVSQLRLPDAGQRTVFEEDVVGGHTVAEVPCVLGDRDHETLIDARIEIQPAFGAPWIGRVSRVTEGTAGESVLHCRGGQDALSRIARAAVYCDTSLHSWKEWAGAGYGSSNIRASRVGGSWWIGLEKGRPPFQFSTYQDTTNNGGGITPPTYTRGGSIWIGLTKGTPVQSGAERGLEFFDGGGITSVAFTWSKKTATEYGIKVYRGTAEGTITATPYSNTGTGASVNLDLTGTSTIWAAVMLYNASGGEFTPAESGHGLAITNLAINGTYVWYKRGGIEHYDPLGIQRLRFKWSKKPTGAYGLVVYRGDSRGTITATVTTGTGTGAAVDLDLSATSTVWVAIALQTLGAFTPSVDGHGIGISDLKVYGVNGVTTITPENVLRHILGQIDATVTASATPASDPAFTMHVGADATVLEPFGVWRDGVYLSEQVEELMRYVQADFGFKSRLVGGRYDSLPVFEAWDEDPAYQMTLDARTVESLCGGDIEPMASTVRGLYVNEDGEESSVTVTDTDGSHYLVALGRRKDMIVRGQLSSAALMTAFCQRWLTLASKIQVAGTIPVEGAIRTTSGAVCHPAEMETGKYILLHQTPLGSVPARIVHLRKTGDTRAEVTVNNSPVSFENELARAERGLPG